MYAVNSLYGIKGISLESCMVNCIEVIIGDLTDYVMLWLIFSLISIEYDIHVDPFPEKDIIY